MPGRLFFFVVRARMAVWARRPRSPGECQKVFDTLGAACHAYKFVRQSSHPNVSLV